MKPNRNFAVERQRDARSQAGYSLIELLIVISIITIVSAYALFAMAGHKNAYKTDDEALQVIDYINTASQFAITKRRTMRLEIDRTANVIRIIDENTAAQGTADDTVMKQAALLPAFEVRVDAAPAGIAQPNPPNYPVAVYAASTHPLSNGNQVCVARFRLDGSVVDVNNNITSLTLFLWPPDPNNSNNARLPQAVRAITVFGGTGVVRLWAYNGTTYIAR
jgi:prepilin-type N-terminal cleavage/methylation domain-containing protein